MSNGSNTPLSDEKRKENKDELTASEKLSPLPLAVSIRLANFRFINEALFFDVLFFWQDVDKPSTFRSNGERLSFSQEPGCSYSNKRSVDDLFGDIDDIDFDIDLPSEPSVLNTFQEFLKWSRKNYTITRILMV